MNWKAITVKVKRTNAVLLEHTPWSEEELLSISVVQWSGSYQGLFAKLCEPDKFEFHAWCDASFANYSSLFEYEQKDLSRNSKTAINFFRRICRCYSIRGPYTPRIYQQKGIRITRRGKTSPETFPIHYLTKPEIKMILNFIYFFSSQDLYTH